MPIPKIGRPTKMTDRMLTKLKHGFAYGLNDVQACLFAGIHPITLERYEKEHPEFSREKEILQEHPINYATEVLFESLKGDGKLALQVLEKINKKYRTTKEVSVKVETFEDTLHRLKDKSDVSDNQDNDPTDREDGHA